MKANRKKMGTNASVMVVVVTLTMTTMQSALFTLAFVGVGRSSSSRAHFDLFESFSNGDDSVEKKTVSVSIPTVTDDNMDTFLHPPSFPDRPVLVDAFAPWCGPCKLLDKVLRKAQPKYVNKVDFCRWNVNDVDNTAAIKNLFLEHGYTLTKLPSLIIFREGKPVAVRPGIANEFQLDDFLEKNLSDVLERTFDENGVKMIPMFPEVALAMQSEQDIVLNERIMSDALVTIQCDALADNVIEEGDCVTPQECIERLENTIWKHRTVVPAINGILLPATYYQIHDSEDLRVSI